MADLKQNGQDKGYCGLGVETGKEDPYWKGACRSHDEAFNELKANMRHDNGLNVTGRFLRDSTSVFLKSIYGVVAFPVYLLVGGLGGLIRWQTLRNGS